MKNSRLQAKDVPDAKVLAEIERQCQERPCYAGAILWDIAARLGLPENLVRAKLDGMQRRGLVTGCTCGCRGDFKVVKKNGYPELSVELSRR
jgi:hypothetical protein